MVDTTTTASPLLKADGAQRRGQENWREDRWGILLIGAMLLAHFVLAVDSARQLTVTHDEYWHIPAGMLSWQTGRFDWDTLNPPLIRLWAALPLISTAVSKGPLEVVSDPAGYGDAFQ